MTKDVIVKFRGAKDFKDYIGRLEVNIRREILPLPKEADVELYTELLNPYPVNPVHHVDLESFLVALRGKIPVGVEIGLAEVYLDPESLREVFRCMIYKNGLQVPYYTSDWVYVLTEVTINHILSTINYLGKDQR